MGKLGNNTQYFVIEKELVGESQEKKGQEPGTQGTGVGRFGPPYPPN